MLGRSNAESFNRHRRELARLSTDCSFLLTHMVRQNGDPQKTDDEAKRDLQSILGLSPVAAA
jgi:hypothetical protein